MACTEKHTVDPRLSIYEHLLPEQPDSIYSVLAQFPVADLDNYNRAYYYVLLTEACEKTEQSLLSSDSALTWALSSRDIRTDTHLWSKILFYKGKIEQKLNDPKAAVVSYHQAMEVSGKTDPAFLADIYSQLGNVYVDQGVYKEAKEMYRKSCELHVLLDDKQKMALDWLHIGNTYLLNDDYRDSVLICFQKALVYAKQSSDSIFIMDYVYNNFAVYYREMEEYELALQQLYWIRSADNLQTCSNKGAIFLHLQQYDSAAYYLHKAVQSQDLYVQAACYFHLNLLEKQTGNATQSYVYLEKYQQLKDSIDNQTKTDEITILNHKNKMDKMVHFMQKQQKIRALLVLGVVGIALLLWAGIFMILERRKKRRQQEQENKLLLQEQELWAKGKVIHQLTLDTPWID
ncbi:MAG: tetratricopeptide repeat protein, partial [Dysgonamonadaceae bacterium]|nr:tetratricopeptide repeat protein [Dysgonamonadaceae bacterium]